MSTATHGLSACYSYLILLSAARSGDEAIMPHLAVCPRCMDTYNTIERNTWLDPRAFAYDRRPEELLAALPSSLCPGH